MEDRFSFSEDKAAMEYKIAQVMLEFSQKHGMPVSVYCETKCYAEVGIKRILDKTPKSYISELRVTTHK